MPQQLLTTSEAASKLGITRQAVRWQIMNHRLKGLHVGSFWLVEWKEVQRALEKRQKKRELLELELKRRLQRVQKRRKKELRELKRIA